MLLHDAENLNLIALETGYFEENKLESIWFSVFASNLYNSYNFLFHLAGNFHNIFCCYLKYYVSISLIISLQIFYACKINLISVTKLFT